MASKSFLTDIQLNQNQILGGVVETVSSTPSDALGVAGQVVYNTTDKKMYQHDGTTWKIVGRTISYDSTGDKVVVSVGDGPETEELVDIILGPNYVEVSQGYVTDDMTVGTAINALDGAIKTIVTTGGEPNQNAFSYLQTDDGASHKGAATAKTDTIGIVGSTFVNVNNVSNGTDTKTATISINGVTSWQTTPDDTHIPSEKLVKDSLDSKEPTLATQTAYTSKGTSTKVPQITTNTKGQVTGITEVSIAFPSGTGSVTGSATSFVKSVSLSDHTLSGTTQTADSTIDSNSTSIPTSQAVLAFVNSSVENVAAYYITKNANGDAFDTKSELTGASTYYSGGTVRVPTRNDYAIVLHDETKATDIGTFATANEYIGYYVKPSTTYIEVTAGNVSTYVTAGTTHAYELPTCRYINSSTTSTPQWDFQYIVNNSGLTAAQIAAINSGITSSKVSTYDTHVSATNNPHSTSISNLTDTTISSPASGEVLKYDGSKWVNGTVTNGTVTSVQVQATSPVVSSTSTAQSTTLNTTISLSDGYGDTKNPYAAKAAGYVLAGPDSGSAAAPSFRRLFLKDIWVALSQSDIVFTISKNNSALTPSNGVATWTISHSQTGGPYEEPINYDFSKAIVSVKESSTGNEVMTDVTYSSSSITIKINSTSNIAANTYTAIIHAPISYS